MNVTGKAVWFVESHLSGNLSLEAVAQAVGVSRFQLSRAFTLSTGGSLSEYVRVRRLTRAAQSLHSSETDVLSIALEAGYGSHEAFTRAFRQHFQCTPEQARCLPAPQFARLNFLEAIQMHSDLRIKLAPPQILHRDESLIFGLLRSYRYSERAGIPAQWNEAAPLFNVITGQLDRAAYGVIVPAGTEEDESFDYLCGVQVSNLPAEPQTFSAITLRRGAYAVFRHPEHVSTIGAVCAEIWNRALWESGLHPDHAPWIERYGPDFNPQTGIGGFEVWIPVVEKATAF